ncbi:MAG: tetratricopeptide repeat protein [Bacteroidales bacterium]|nr:tetratricopeptide repeat protein [Bacteroidales bacterium]
MKYRSLFLFFGFLTAHLVGFSQQSIIHNHEDVNYKTGMELFQKEKYVTAQKYFEKAEEIYADQNTELKAKAQYYQALCAIRLFNDDAEYLTFTFISQNFGNPLVNQARFELGGYFYGRKRYSSAIEYYSQVDPYKLSKPDQSEYYFKLGYCYFSKDDLDNARLAFYQIKDIKSKYTIPALYYYSHINYSQKNYQTALEGFLRLSDDPTFADIVPYYITQIYYLQEKYNEVISYAPSKLENVNEKRIAEVSRIIGESYYMQDRFSEAIPYLEKYMETAPYVNKEDKYQLGYAYYKAGELDKAIDMFENISSGNSLLSQNALYHLADCYLKKNDKSKARMAFSSASKMDFDDDIRKDALFNYAMVTYELSLSPFNEAIIAFNEYIRLYPASPRIDEAYRYLVMAYMNTNNYSLALESIEKIQNKPPEIKEAYQKIAFYRGLELYNNLNFSEAIILFDNSLKYGIINRDLASKSYYWKGEAYYRLNDFDKAILNYKKYIDSFGSFTSNEYNLAHYNIGYAFFKKKNYTEAANWFRKYTGMIKSTNSQTLADAYIRIGDCFYVQSDYYSADDFYSRAIESGLSDPDYALFQKGFSLGLLNKDEEKIKNLSSLLSQFPQSPYADDALYEIGESYVKLQNPEAAISRYNKIVADYPNSDYVRRALVRLGLIYYNTDRNNESLQYYKRAVNEYPNTPEAKNALTGIKNIYVDQNNVDAYIKFVNSLGGVAKVSTSEQDSLSYYTAENIYLNGDCVNSMKSFASYIQNFPEGSFILNAHFYKGDCNYQMQKFSDAMQSFDYIINQPRNVFTLQALLGASRIQYNEKNYDKALGYYLKLEEAADVKSNLLEARIGKMRCYYYLNNWDKTIDASRQVIYAEKLKSEQEREARFMLAKSLFARDRLVLALEEFTQVAKDLKSLDGAESKFRVAEIYFKQNELEKAEKEILDFTEKTTPHQYWMAKSFILWADIFAKKGDDFQAIQTLQSIIDYYEENNDGILKEAREKRAKFVARQEADEKVVAEPEIEINIDDVN